MKLKLSYLLILYIALSGCRREEEDLAKESSNCNCSNTTEDENDSNGTSLKTEPKKVVINLGEQYLAAAASGNINEIKKYLSNPEIDPLAVDKQGQSALMLATKFGHLAAVKLLIDQFPTMLEIKNIDGKTARNYALEANLSSQIEKEVLVAIVSGEEIGNDKLELAFFETLQKGDPETGMLAIKFLLENGVSPNAFFPSEDESSEIPALAITMGFSFDDRGRVSKGLRPVIEYAQTLVDAGADTNATINVRGKDRTLSELIRYLKRDVTPKDYQKWEALFE